MRILIKMIRTISLLWIFFLSTSTLVQAQEYKEVLKELKKRNASARQIHMVMDIQIFAALEDEAPVHSQKTVIKKKNENYWYKNDQSEILMNDHDLIMIDHEMKQIMIGNRDKTLEADLASSFTFDLDTLISIFGEPKLVDKKDGVNHYRLKQVGEMEVIDFYLDTHNYAVKKVMYEYSSKQYVVLNFPVFNLDAQLSDDDFKSSRYIRRMDGQISPAYNLKGYKVAGEGI